MASFPQFYSDDSFSSAEFSQFPYPISAAVSVEMSSYGECSGTVSVSSGSISSGTGPIWGTEESFPIISYDNVLAPDQSDVISPSPMMPFPAENLGIWDSAVATLADYNNMAMCGTNEIQNYGARFQSPSDACEFGDDCCAFMHGLEPMYAATGENWGIQNNQMPSMEDGNNVIKVGRYSVEERKHRILRYLKKKNQRNFNKTIKYACRKTLADRRVRVRGRFARNNDQLTLCEEDHMVMKNNNDNIINSLKEKNLYCADDVHVPYMIKQDEEWLQEAMASLMYLPYI